MDVMRIKGHLIELENIAKNFNNSRSIENGYNASVEYVVNTLTAQTDYKIEIQYFPVNITKIYDTPVLSLLSPISINYTYGDLSDFIFMGNYQGQLNINAKMSSISNLGCVDSDFENHNVTGSFALVKR
jgi:hypothetical protein